MNKPIRLFHPGGYRRFCWPWWKGWFEFLTTGWFYDLKTYWHRARHGWAPRDTWSLDMYLDGVLAGALAHLADSSHGVPAGYPGVDVDSDVDIAFGHWTADLRRWAKAFEDAARDDYYEIHGRNYDAWHADEKARLAAVHQALKEMEPWWDALWD
jgi:hypothetical protein